jgi:hypothetical protein
MNGEMRTEVRTVFSAALLEQREAGKSVLKVRMPYRYSIAVHEPVRAYQGT